MLIYSIEFVGDSSIKFYTDSNLINNNIYGSINSNLTGVITIYYKSNSNIDNKPTSCTGNSDLCWDVSYDSNQDKKVYAYLTDSELTDSTDTTKTLYDLHVVSTGIILAPQGCWSMFSILKDLVEINFNNKFDASSAIDMENMFDNCSSLTILDLSNFDTSNVTGMSNMFRECAKLRVKLM